MRKAVIYARVSSTSDRQSTARQVSDLRAYADREGLEIVKVFQENGSGAKEDRPVLQKCISFCEEQNTELLVSEVSRLGLWFAFRFFNFTGYTQLKLYTWLILNGLACVVQRKNPAIFSLDFFIMYLFFGSYKSYSTGSWGRLSEKSNIPQWESGIRFWPCIGVRSILVSRGLLEHRTAWWVTTCIMHVSAVIFMKSCVL